MKRNTLCLCILGVAVSAPSARADWTTVGDGIEYQMFSISGPNKVFVTRMNRSNTNAYLESSIGQGRTSGGTETVPNQFSRYEDAIGYWTQTWGTRNDVVVAVNGSYYNTTTGEPHGGLVHSGWYAKRYDNVSGMSGFMWDLNRNATMGLCVTHYTWKQLITYVSDGSVTQEFQGINVDPGDNQITIFTPQYDTNTKTDNSVSEVVLRMARPALLIPTPNMAQGVVTQIRPNAGSTPMQFDEVVLSAKGSAANTLLGYATLGDTIGISQEVKHLDKSCATSRSLDWTKAYAGVSGNWVFLRDGEIIYGIDSSGARHPRTGIGFNSSYVFYMVVDGRQAGYSIGMTIDEMAEFFKNTLAATWACNQDGGGSSTMVVNGEVKNIPSDGPGTPRPVANGMLMCNLVAKAQSSAFSNGQTVTTTTSANCRLGPGTNYAVITAVPGGTAGTVQDHNLNGVAAKSYYWWKVSFPSATGWVAESLLSGSGDAPSITEHPVGRTVLPGGTASFTVQAAGTAPLNYQWQKDTADIYDGGPFSGTQTSTLTVSGATPSETGAYRCVVTNGFGNATSNEATLAISSPDFDDDGDVDQADFAHLQFCFGTTDLLAVPQCADADLNGDGGVDAQDTQDFQRCASGPEVPMDPACGASP